MRITSYPEQSLSQSDATIMVDDFVTTVLCSSSLAFRTPSDPDVKGDRRLQRYMPCLRAMADLFAGRVDYDTCEHLQLFNNARLEIQLKAIGSCFTCPAPNGSDRYLSDRECFNQLIKCIRKNGHDGSYVRSLGDRAHDFKTRSYELKAYVEAVMEVYPRTMVVRVNLRYMGAFKSWFRVGDVFADRCRLLNVIASHPVFADLSGYVLEIEQTYEEGFYIHATFFLDGSKVKSEADHIQRIGELWDDVTDGRGCWDDIGQGLAGWHEERRWRTTGLFDRADVTTILRMAKGMTSLDRACKSLRIMPEDGQALITGRWPNSQSYQAA